MLQDYTVYTHLPEPLETPLLPGRRMLAALPALAAHLIGKQSRGGVLSMWSRFPRLLEIRAMSYPRPCSKPNGEPQSRARLASVSTEGRYHVGICVYCVGNRPSRPVCRRTNWSQLAATAMHGRLRARAQLPWSAIGIQSSSRTCFCHFHQRG
jgi:hypothetical protein